MNEITIEAGRGERQYLAGPLALPRVVLFPRVAGHPRPLQADRHRRRVGGDPPDPHDAGADLRIRPRGGHGHGRRALSDSRVLRHAAMAVLRRGIRGERQQPCRELGHDLQGVFPASGGAGEQRDHELRRFPDLRRADDADDGVLRLCAGVFDFRAARVSCSSPSPPLSAAGSGSRR